MPIRLPCYNSARVPNICGPSALIPMCAKFIYTITGAEKPLGEWNTMEITCRGNEIEVKVNGYLVNQAKSLSQQCGAIALQSEGTPIEYRNIKLAKLRGPSWPEVRQRRR